MKTISLKDIEQKDVVYREAADVLKQGGLVCLPCAATYRILADLSSESAVLNLFQSKHRTQNAPSLAFVADKTMLGRIVRNLDPVAQRLIDRLWPGNLTILVDPVLDLSPKVARRITKVNGKLGVRMPEGETVLKVVRAFGGPVLVSSANIERKKGAYSPAQIRKNFINRVDLFLDAGDLPAMPPSTVVVVEDGRLTIVRPGAFSENEILAAAGP